MTTRKLPQTDSIQELARFWDNHDLTEFEDQLEIVTESVFERRAANGNRRKFVAYACNATLIAGIIGLILAFVGLAMMFDLLPKANPKIAAAITVMGTIIGLSTGALTAKSDNSVQQTAGILLIITSAVILFITVMSMPVDRKASDKHALPANGNAG